MAQRFPRGMTCGNCGERLGAKTETTCPKYVSRASEVLSRTAYWHGRGFVDRRSPPITILQ
jgi:hypothetical protein